MDAVFGQQVNQITSRTSSLPGNGNLTFDSACPHSRTNG